jgi:hypothetical protein
MSPDVQPQCARAQLSTAPSHSTRANQASTASIAAPGSQSEAAQLSNIAKISSFAMLARPRVLHARGLPRGLRDRMASTRAIQASTTSIAASFFPIRTPESHLGSGLSAANRALRICVRSRAHISLLHLPHQPSFFHHTPHQQLPLHLQLQLLSPLALCLLFLCLSCALCTKPFTSPSSLRTTHQFSLHPQAFFELRANFHFTNSLRLCARALKMSGFTAINPQPAHQLGQAAASGPSGGGGQPPRKPSQQPGRAHLADFKAVRVRGECEALVLLELDTD